LDQNEEIGGIWAHNFYDVALQAPFYDYTLVDFGFEEGVERFPRLPALQNFLKNYVKFFGFGEIIKLGHKVDKIEQNPDFTWTVEVTSQGKTQKNYMIS